MIRLWWAEISQLKIKTDDGEIVGSPLRSTAGHRLPHESKPILITAVHIATAPQLRAITNRFPNRTLTFLLLPLNHQTHI